MIRVGIDFDNTIVCYDGVFYAECLKRGLIPQELPRTKEAVRDYLRGQGQEPIWTELQGYVYGPGIKHAKPFDGIKEFLKACSAANVRTFIVSHKTRHPYAGPKYDLHESARAWLGDNGFLCTSETGLSAEHVFFELTKDDKLSRIGKQECNYFIDDLPELLSEPAFPAGVERILFDPSGAGASKSRFRSVSSWFEVLDSLLVAKTSSHAAVHGL